MSSKVSAKTNRRSTKKVDTTYTIKVTLEELYTGNTRYLQIKDLIKCLLCKYKTIHRPVPNSKCKRCLGYGIQPRDRLIKVNIRKGMINGDKIIFEGAAMLETGYEEPGKLIITLEEQEHPVFKRWQNNLYMIKPLKSKSKQFGCQNMIETIDGRMLTITNTGGNPRQDILLGEGLPVYGRKPTGSLFVRYV